jgi:hypothetical protein
MRMAISLRLAASSLRIGLIFFMRRCQSVPSRQSKILHGFTQEAIQRR